jgi:phosphatidylglycerophosphate synthase
MDVISIVLILFGALELSNVLLLYLAPGSRRGNSIGFFNAYEKSKQDPEVHALVSYLVNWVAGTKLIFIVLLIGILITGRPSTKVFTVIALIFSIMTFFSRLYPQIKKMDQHGEITPHGYSRTLAIMIGVFIAVFAGAVIIYLAGSPKA